MNNQQNTIARIHEIFNKGVSGVIVLPPNPTPDAISAATTLYLGLTKMGKNVSLACESKPNSDLIGVDKIQPSLATGGDSLMVTFPYIDGAIDKVDYNIQGNSFNLIITPRPGYQKLNPTQVNYSYTGGTVDFIVTIDAPTLNSLGTLYTENQTQFTGHDIINIDRHLTNAFFGTVNLVNKTISSISELALAILEDLKIEIDRDMATNLYAGIATATNNFTSYSVNADTFESIATLMRLGAIKKVIRKPVSQPIAQNQFQTPVVSAVPKIKITNQNMSPSLESQPTTVIEEVEKEKQPSQTGFENKSGQDWLKPKIFKNGGLI